MNEDIDLTKILDGCPQGTKFYHIVFGTVSLLDIRTECVYPIRFTASDNCCYAVNRTGISNIAFNGECVLFPSKDQRDWSKFERFWDKPKVERFDLKTLLPLDKLLVRDMDTDEWHLDLFSNITHFGECACVGGCWAMAIPYNDDTKHLLGEAIDCDRYYAWWEDSDGDEHYTW